MTVDAATLATPHEELLVLKNKSNIAYRNWTKRQYTPFSIFFGRAKAIAELEHLSALAQESDSAYKEAFNKVLKEQHGVDSENIVDFGDSSVDHHKFTVLLERKIREMSAVTIGKRIVFFVEGTALGESEKASYSPQ